MRAGGRTREGVDVSSQKPTEKQIRDRLVAEIADVMSLAAERVDSREPFASYGIASVEAVHLVGKLETWLGLTLDPTLLWDHPTIDALANHLAGLAASS
jgi:acyl carrier protein